MLALTNSKGFGSKALIKALALLIDITFDYLDLLNYPIITGKMPFIQKQEKKHQ